MFKVKSSEHVFNLIDEACAGVLADIILVYPEFKQKLLSELRWGIYSNQAPKLKPKKGYLFASNGRFEPLMQVSDSYVEEAKQALKEADEKEMPFFDVVTENLLKHKSAEVAVDYESLDVLVDLLDIDESYEQGNGEPVVALTLPDSETVFAPLMTQTDNWKDLIKFNSWLYEYMDSYEEWRYKVMAELFDYTYQVGGHGRWIQGDFNNRYLGQANLGLGDDGSVYIYTDNDTFKGHVDMY